MTCSRSRYNDGICKWFHTLYTFITARLLLKLKNHFNVTKLLSNTILVKSSYYPFTVFLTVLAQRACCCDYKGRPRVSVELQSSRLLHTTAGSCSRPRGGVQTVYSGQFNSSIVGVPWCSQLAFCILSNSTEHTFLLIQSHIWHKPSTVITSTKRIMKQEGSLVN